MLVEPSRPLETQGLDVCSAGQPGVGVEEQWRHSGREAGVSEMCWRCVRDHSALGIKLNLGKKGGWFAQVFRLFLFYTGVKSIYNDVIVSGVQQSGPVTHTCVSVLFQILFPFRSSQNIEPRSLRCTAGPCWLSVSNTAVCVCPSQIPVYLCLIPSLFSTSESASLCN